MKALFIVTVLYLTSSLEAASHCHWGPSYWCKSRETAKECQQTSYCQENVWKGSSVTMVKEPTIGACDICLTVVQTIEGLLENNATETEIEQEIEKVCSDLGPLSSECTSLVDQYFDQIWKLVIEKLSPSEVCSTIGLCNSTALRTRHPASLRKAKENSVSVKKVGGIQCTVCQIVVQAADKLLGDNATEQEVEQEIEKVCDDLGALASTCKSLVDEYFPQIWQYLVNGLSPDQVCSTIGLCSSATHKTRSLQKAKGGMISRSVSGLVECRLCEEVASIALKEVNENSTEEMTKEAILRACKYMGGLASMCRGLINKDWNEIYSNVMKYIDQPEKLCAAVKLCASDMLLFKQMMPRADLCDICDLVVAFIKPFVDNDNTKEEAKVALEQVCGLLPGGIGNECKSLVDGNFDVIWALIEGELENDLICNQLGLCNSTKTTRPMKKLMSFQQMPRASACDLCKLATTFLKPYVDSNTTEEEVKTAVEQVCTLLPGAIGDECKSLIDEYFDQIWDLVKQEVDTDLVCVQLGLCNSTKTTQLAKQSMSVKRMPRASACDLCKLATTFLAPYVDSNTTEQEAKAAVEQACNLLPGNIGSECTSLIDQYFDLIWQLLKAEVDGGEICIQLGLCNSTKITTKSKIIQSMPRASACDLCKLATTFLAPYVDSNTTEQEAKAAVEQVCNVLPGGVASECTSLIDQYFDTIWGLLKDEVDGGVICNQLGLCNSTKITTKVSVKGFECQLCQMVSNELKTLMAKNDSETEVQDALKKLCSIVPGSLGSNCSKMVNQYFMLGWVVMKEMVDAGTMCSYIKMCPSNAIMQLKSSAPKNIILCEACTVIMEVLVSELSKNDSEQKIQELLDKVCDLPYLNKYSNECLTLINEYSDKIIQLILSGVAPREICKMIAVCTSAKTKQLLHMAGGMECTVCKEVLTVAKMEIGSKTAESEIAKVLEKVCSIVTSGIKAECVGFISTFGPELVNILAKAIEPDAICREIKLCSASSLMEPWAKIARKY